MSETASNAEPLFKKAITVGTVTLDVVRSELNGAETITAQITSKPPFITPPQKEIETEAATVLGHPVKVEERENVDDTILFVLKRVEQAERPKAPAALQGSAMAIPEPAPAPAPIPAATPAAPAKPPKAEKPKSKEEKRMENLESDSLALRKVQEKRYAISEMKQELEAIDDSRKAKKAAIKEAGNELDRLIKLSREERQGLFARVQERAEPKAAPTPPAARNGVPAADESWKQTPIAKLKDHGLSDNQYTMLTAGRTKNGEAITFKNLGDLTSWQAKVGESVSVPLSLIKGWGGKAQDLFDNVMQSFWAAHAAQLQPAADPPAEAATPAAAESAPAKAPAKPPKTKGGSKKQPLQGGLGDRAGAKPNTLAGAAGAELNRRAAKKGAKKAAKKSSKK